MSELAKGFEPPYYAVIFTSVLSEADEGYAEMAGKMVAASSRYPGFLGLDSARAEVGITVCYWQDLASIERWKADELHRTAQQLGFDQWYQAFELRIARVEKAYGFAKNQ